MSSGVALLVAGHVEPGPRESLLRTLGQIGDALRAADSQWQVRQFGVTPDDRGTELDPRSAFEASPPHGAVAVVVLVGQIAVGDAQPALVLSARGEQATEATLPLGEIGDWIRSSRAGQVVLVLAGWSDTGVERALAATWFDALATDRSRDLVAVGAGGSAVALVEALLDAFTGGASDPATGTLTLRSLGEDLARRVPGAVIQRSSASQILLQPPPLSGAADPRLMRRSQLATESGLGDGWQTEPDDLTGVVLPGQFRIDAMMARGGFGTIFRARQLTVERNVAVKVLHTTVDPGSPSGRLFVQEIQSVGRIDHPNVVCIYQADVTAGGRLFFAMELLAGRDLEQLVKTDGTLAVARAVALTRQLLAGLSAAHEAGLVHADVKPANAIVVPDRDGERVVLVDFGLARLRMTDEPARSVGGTPAYMAPEQLRDGHVDARSDVFSAALVLVTLLTGWRRRAIDELAPPLDDMADPALRAVVRRALALEPAERFQTAAAFDDALAATETAGTAPPARSATGAHAASLEGPARGAGDGLEPAGRARRRRRWPWIAALGLATLAGGAARWRLPGAATADLASARPTVLVGGSGTILFGFLGPRVTFLEQRSFTSIPIRSAFDVGSEGGMRTLQAGEIDLAALSTRFTRAVPVDLAAAGKLLVEVAVGFDETALFVRRDNPLRVIDIAAVRAHLCCGHGEALRPTIWSDLGLATPPFATRAVGWTVFGREHPPMPLDSTSATLLQADAWLCEARQLCASARSAADVAANEVLASLATDSDALLLSTRAFSTEQVVPLVVVDRAHHTRLDGRKVLWLYLPAAPGAAIPARICRFFDAVLDASFVAKLAAVGKAQGLPADLRQRQRRALGLEDGSCAWRPIVARAAAGELAHGILRSPIGADVEIATRWVVDPGS
jgi:Protein kinase domain